jgi:hypothetical protein
MEEKYRKKSQRLPTSLIEQAIRNTEAGAMDHLEQSDLRDSLPTEKLRKRVIASVVAGMPVDRVVYI